MGGVLFSTGLGFVSHMNENITQQMKFAYEVLVGTGVGLMVMANLPLKDHAIANGVTGLGGALGAWVPLCKDSQDLQSTNNCVPM
ncbi:hypothetical protein N0V82_007133 [Gnomoniopsis sp. IMI 355080]|nr:hypothetical protein N0V82_007133 [Gnomoniopsis sp. IMI 355080]